jgi:predicted nucleotidyltransferase
VTGSPGAALVYKDGLYNGRTLAEWVPDVVEQIVDRFDPLRILLFGSVARGEDGPDSDIDLLVVLPELRDKRETMIELLRAAAIGPPVDVIPTDPDEIKRRGELLGTVLRPALREGKVVYERAD